MNNEAKLSRRSFLGLAGISGLGLAAGMTGCAPKAAGDAGDATSKGGETGWRAAPEAVADSKIAETLEADIVVVGTGASGSIAITTALDAGATVIGLQKESYCCAHGLFNAAHDTIFTRLMGYEMDVPAIKQEWYMRTGGYCSMRHLNHWVENSPRIVNHLLDMRLQNPVGDLGAINYYGWLPGEVDPWNSYWPTEHQMIEFGEAENREAGYLVSFGFRELSQWLCDRAEERGAQILYETPGVQLVRDDGGAGRVSAVIGQRADGSYVKCVAKKAVILCAGGYSNNEEMVAEFLPHLGGMKSGYSTLGNAGDAIRMGYWVGGQIQAPPHTVNAHYDPTTLAPDLLGSDYPWLCVNLNGERYQNEDVAYEQLYAGDTRNPENTHFQIFDDDYPTYAPKMGMGYFRTDAQAFIDMIPGVVESGDVYKADTIAELAAAIGVDAAALQATVDRYNELVEIGEDLDFGKQAARLYPIAKAPFYAMKRIPTMLDTMSGLMTNVDLQVLDESDEVIEGLYAAGNCQSPFYGGFVQPMNTSGLGSGRAFATGHVAALRACGLSESMWPTTDELIEQHPEYVGVVKGWLGIQ